MFTSLAAAMPSSMRLRHDLYGKDPDSEPMYLPEWPDWRTGYHYFKPTDKQLDPKRPTLVLYPDPYGPTLVKVQDGKYSPPPPSPATCAKNVASTSLPRVAPAYPPPSTVRSAWQKKSMPTAMASRGPSQAVNHSDQHLPRVSPNTRMESPSDAAARLHVSRKVWFSDNTDEEKETWLQEKYTSYLPGLVQLRDRKPTPQSVAKPKAAIPSQQHHPGRLGKTNGRYQTRSSKSAPPLPANATSGPLWEHCSHLFEPVEIQALAGANVPNDVVRYHNDRNLEKWQSLCHRPGFPCVYRVENPDPHDEATALPKQYEAMEDSVYKDTSVLSSRGYFHFRESNFRKRKSSLKPWRFGKWW